MSTNRQILVAELPQGRLEERHFRLHEAAVPEPADGEVLCRTLELSSDAAMRAGIQGSASYAGKPTTDIVMGGGGIARVEASRHSNWKEGDLVSCRPGWQDYAALPGDDLRRITPLGPLSWELGILGGTGMTAYFGLFDVGRPEPGETVLVSAAGGAVGSVVGQLAKIHGCRAVGTTGSDNKCAKLQSELGFDAAVNYKSDDFRDELKGATPDGVDVYFDNTGGHVLGSALFRANQRGRIVCCGVVSQYDTSSPEGGPRGVPGLLVNKRLRMEGFLVFDYVDRYEEARRQLADWIEAGKLNVLEDRFDGLESAPRALVDLLAGGNLGKRSVHVAD
ncbi:MAG: NADP-dependent oxidoreductase [Acidobacteriota bacterium]